jgi:hypothetical protein
MLEPPLPEPRVRRPDGESPAPLLARVATSPSDRAGARALLPAHAPIDGADCEREIVVLYDPADPELAGAALIGRLSVATTGLFACSTRWVDERLALRRLLQAVADRARTRGSVSLAVRSDPPDVILREVLAELGYRAAHRALLAVESPHERGAASWFVLGL